ncbi:alpha-2-macroglobulin family protein [Flavobacterium sp. UBA7663]|uniref:alpha-2-macroglobulin family protein n=1 Tax=Flavobacterium sp. UBA7663 TaxID=1946557 RepID=UPI0025B8EC3E|nr:alpha-2-macroglobulin family protein [Flavobacterium sp. UBA7663]
MRKILLLILLVNSFNLFAQYDDKWKEVYRYELDGKVKSAQEKVQEIYKKAKRKNDETQIIKCFFYLSKFEQVFDEKAQTTIINNLQKEINEAKPVSKAVLQYVYITILEEYYQRNNYNINKRTYLENQKSKDFLTWTEADFNAQIEKNYDNLLSNENELRNTSIEKIKEIFDISSSVDIKNFSVYDFLAQKKGDHLKSAITSWKQKKSIDFKSEIEIFYENPESFVKYNTKKLEDDNLKKLITLLQNNEKYYLNQKNYEKLDFAYYERLKFIKETFWDEEFYLKKATSLEKTTTNLFLKQLLRVDRAWHYYNKTHKKGEFNSYTSTLKLVDTILNTKVNVNALAEAEKIKIEINNKHLEIKLPKISYPKQNNRAFVNFKNIDSLTISYYELPQKLNYLFKNNYYYNNTEKLNKDSIINAFLLKNKVFKTQKVVLPNKRDYFEYSTEVLLEKLDVGNYLIYIETPNDTISNEKVFAFDILQVTNLYVIEDNEENKDAFYIYDRKLGKPLEDVKIASEEENIKTNANGNAYFKHKWRIKDKKYSNDILITSKNDSLSINYNRNFLSTNEFNNKSVDDYENWEAKAMIYFDRAIYRPGQKMFYKGVIIQKKDAVKNVVPFVTVHVTISDVNNTKLKEYDVQTNEFGSFSGEFEIPKNVLTGEFSIKIEEADNYEKDSKYYDKKEDEHIFWDNVDFESYNEFNFKVEEYKRPTFEIVFDEIKENYTIEDTINIKGNAKALAGNNLTNAKVAYTISKSGYSKTKNISYEINYINSETTTDENGNFTISFSAIEPSVANEEIESFNFSITIDVTDIQGETRSASKNIIVGKEMLKIGININGELISEDNNKLIISTTTLNNYPIEAKGTLKIYELKSRNFLKKRQYAIPEIQTLTKEEFHNLFPHEPFDETDEKTEEILIKTISFDTKINKEIALNFLKNYRNSQFKIIAESYDLKNNLITNEKAFSVKSKQFPFSEKELFTYKDITDSKSKFYTIEIQSVIPDLYITSRFYVDKNMTNDVKTIQLINGKAIFKFNKELKFTNSLTFHFSTIWENEGYVKSYQIETQTTESKLQIEIERLRNKIEPGSIENWSFKINNPELQAEILASMYDSSLDLFATNNWKNFNFHVYYSYPRTPQITNYQQNISFNLNNFKTQRSYFAIFKRNPQLYWFGFDFNDPKNPYNLKNYTKRISIINEIPKNSKLISGIISDELGPIAGANVYIKGSNRGTTTDFDGEFTIEAAKGEIIVVSYTGKKSEEITIEQAKNLEITLNEDVVSGLDVVVTGYGKTTKEAYVGTATSYNSENSYEDDGYLSQALKGQIAGVSVKNDTLSNGRVMIRGFGSVIGNKNPLYVIDGIPVSEDNLDLDPNNIESLIVLKDAAATSIYGSSGANGVIIITTKNALKELAQVKTRSNFNETAFFYPHLKTDSNGEFSFQFTTPESLTKWKLRLFAHNKNFESGYFESSIISQKDVMIQTNMPRFVREKDEITITAKVVNLTNEIKSGNAMLLLFDATTMQPIDVIANNSSNVKAFNCKSKESVPVSWTVTIPEGVQGLQYKIVAKSGNFSDGEENILPVMSNKVLLTESIPIWVKGNSKKEYVFDNLKNDNSKSLKNHLFTLEYTSNPTWLALQSLPYLMEYEHECAEQTFSRYYGNFIATEIISSNPKIATLFESWKNNPKAVSKLTQNEELKSIVLNETPWLLDAESEELKNKRLALLMDLNTMKDSQERTLKKIEEKQLVSGAFAWFDGGEENTFITQHIVAGLGHLGKLFPEKKSQFEKITSKAIPYLDNKYNSQSTLKNNRINYYAYSNLHFLYARSFYLDKMPISKKMDSIINVQKVEFKANWLTYSLYKKALLALTMHRFGDKNFAEKIITNLKETVARNDDYGMYWIENKNGYYWYQSAIETQAILIEAFAEIEKDKTYVDEMKVWLLKQKQISNWPTTKSTTEAIYALLLQGTNWTSIKDNTKFKIGNEKVFSKKLSEKDKEATTGYIKMNWKPEEISKDMGKISIENKSDIAGFGGLYWQYFEDLQAIKSDSTSTLSITKTLYKKTKTTEGDKLVEINSENVKIGDLITIRLIIKTDNDLEFVHLKDLRASCFEPIDVISEYKWKSGLSYYQSTKDVATHFFFDTIKKGTYVLEYDVRINNSGSFNDGIATLQSMYAPEFTGHSTSTKLKIQD